MGRRPAPAPGPPPAGAGVDRPRDAPSVPPDAPSAASDGPSDGAEIIRRAFENRQSDIQVQAAGVVKRLLSDDRDGSRHQRFIFAVAEGPTVLISHNIDLAPRVAPLAVGDRVEFCGEYEWNNQGGVIHWTHRDPAGRHVNGWLKHQGKTYQ